MEALALLLLLALVAWGSVSLKWITLTGALAGVVVAVGAYAGGGGMALSLLGVFFVLGSLSTKWKKKEKAKLGLEQAQGGQRSVPNVLANGLVPALLGYTAYATGTEAPWVWPMLAAAVASATSDTISSELGSLYGRRFWDVRTWRSSQRGADGVISVEGTALGALASFVIACPAAWWQQDARLIWMVGLSGLAGNLADSYLGAYLQRQGWLNNHTVNFWSSLTAAVLAYCLFAIPNR